ncbi:MAG: translation elongation factor Ts [Wolbachia endosymbiont of Menacanthus eurysternus]|nr:MAG: translation elongation factor Ts [Wolbachia endosymbiont of Menacanthus eurysternus]
MIAIINQNDIRELRKRTGLGLGDCKKTLEECDGDIERAIDKLRVVGFAEAANKRFNSKKVNGLIAMHLTENRGVLIELNCETDFVARNEKFMELVSNLVLIASQESCSSIDELKNVKYYNNDNSTITVQEVIINSISVFGEKLELSRLCYLEVQNGIVAGYVHGGLCGFGRIGALVALRSSCNKLKLQEIGKQIAMHIVAMKPEALSIDGLDHVKLNSERSMIEKYVKSLNKSEEVEDKIISDRLAKYYEEVVLLEQKFIMDDKKKVSDFIRSKELDVNSTIKLSDYKLLILGNRED